MNLSQMIQNQTKLMDDISDGTAKHINSSKEGEKMGKMKHSVRRQNIPLQELVDLIRPDVLEGLDKKAICKKHHLELGRVVKAMDSLNHDPEVLELRKKRDEEKRQKEISKKKKETVKKNIEPSKTKEVEKQSQQKSSKTSKGYTISDDIKLAIAEDYETTKYTQKELAKKYNVSTGSVSLIIADLIPEDKRKEIRKKTQTDGAQKRTAKRKEETKQALKEINEFREKLNEQKKDEQVVEETKQSLKEFNEEIEVVEAEIIDDKEDTNGATVFKSFIDHTLVQPSIADSIKFMYPTKDTIQNLIEVDSKSTFKIVGLINNRHNMDVNTYIYNSIPNSRIFDFEWLESTAAEFIKNNIKYNKNGIPTQGLIVKCTGLQTAIMALTKACYQMRINLIISHHQLDKGVDQKYRQQPIFTDFDIATEIPYTLTHINNSVSKLFLYKSTPAEYFDIPQFYELHVVNKEASCRNNRSGDRNSKPISTYSILAKTLEDSMMISALMSRVFNIDRSYFRYTKLNQYDIDHNNSSLGYSSFTMQTSYF